MEGRQGFSLLLVPRGQSEQKVREIRLSGRALVTLGASVATLLVLLVAGVATYGFVLVDQIRYSNLQRENRILRSQIVEMGSAVQGLADQMSLIAERDEAVRLAAGLDEISADVRRAGIGGSYRDFDRQVLMLDGPEAGLTKRLQETLNRLSREVKLESESLLDVKAHLEQSSDFLRGYPSIFPVDRLVYPRAYVSSAYKMRDDPLDGTRKFHYGNDIAARRGTPVRATADGVVIGADNSVRGRKSYGLGNNVRIDHGNGYATAYGHMQNLATGIRRGVRVKRGQVIGYVGDTGRAEGIHLHYEVYLNGKNQNPWFYYYSDRVADVTGVRDLPVYRNSTIAP